MNKKQLIVAWARIELSKTGGLPFLVEGKEGIWKQVQ